MVLEGSIIEEGAIVAAGSIVAGKLSANCIYAGSPAKKIKEGTHWIRERI